MSNAISAFLPEGVWAYQLFHHCVSRSQTLCVGCDDGEVTVVCLVELAVFLSVCRGGFATDRLAGAGAGDEHSFLMAAWDFATSRPLPANQLACSKVMKSWRQSAHSLDGSSDFAISSHALHLPYDRSAFKTELPQSLQVPSWQPEHRPPAR